MDSKWSKIVKGLLNEEDYLEKQTKAFRKTRLTVIKQMQEEMRQQELLKTELKNKKKGRWWNLSDNF